MIRVLLFLFTFIISQDYILVNFYVDMSNEIISDNGVHLMGSDETYTQFGIDPETESVLSAWDPASIELLDDNNDNIFEVTLGLLPNTNYLYKFINGNTFGEGESSNREYSSTQQDESLEIVCYDSINPCASFDGTEISSLTFKTNVNNAIANNGFSLGDMLIVRWGYGGTQFIEQTDTLTALIGTEYSITVDNPEVKLDEGLYYQYYKIIDNIQYREVYFNFNYDASDQNLAERRYIGFEEVQEGDSVEINDTINSNVDARRRPTFQNTNQINEDIVVTWEVDMRPAYYQVYSGSNLDDVQGDIDISSAEQVYELGVWMNGPATNSANGEDWTQWGETLSATESKKMWDDGTNGDQVEGDHIYSIQLNYDSESTFGQEFKLGIGGGDNESGYGLNHIENINIDSPTIRTYWGSINPLFYNAWDYDLNEPTIELCSTPGDSNLDNFVDILDVVLVISYIVGEVDLSGKAACNSDFNDDGNINILDVVVLVSSIVD